MTEPHIGSACLPRITLPLIDGVRIVVPNVCNQLTPYVLIEQQDWFEDEIKFLRQLLQVGDQAIDIGANYGVYSLSMAKSVGPNGRVWAFEPASETADFLAESIVANRFDQLTLVESGVSKATGSARLSLNIHSESNALIEIEQAAVASEVIQLTSLDESMVSFGWKDIAFLKIDAEGEEANIIEGGKRFFEQRSPLVQYEVNASGKLRFELIAAFAEMGYESFRLIPGLDLLAPFDQETDPNEFILNLFCCKPDRAAILAATGRLVRTEQQSRAALDRVEELTYLETTDAWRSMLAKFPYARELGAIWEKTIAQGESGEVCRAISLYAISRDRTRSALDRLTALKASLESLKAVCHARPSYQRLASLARVARDYGERCFAVSTLQEVCRIILSEQQVDLREPFLVPEQRYESVEPRGAYADWMLSSALEAYELSVALSTFYTGRASLERLERILDLGFCSEEMRRRRDMIMAGYGQPSLLQPT